MGGGYSDLNVYYTERWKYYDRTLYKVESRTKNFQGCSDFEEVTHTITFTEGKPLDYNVLLYDGTNDKNKGKRVFGYYHPRNDNEVIQEVRTYYSVLAPNVPLVISFALKGNLTYNCLLGELQNARWDYSSNIARYSFRDNLNKDFLGKEFRKLSLKRTIQFTIGEAKTDIEGERQELGGNLICRFIFIPKGNVSVLGSESLFSLESNKPKPQNTIKNQIDPYYLTSVKDHFFDGIMVYFAEEIMKQEKYEDKDVENRVLLLQLINSCKTTYFKRRDNDGYWWSEEQVTYTDDNSLVNELEKIKDQTEDVNTVILDGKKTYKGVQDVKTDETNKACIKYTHKYESSKKSVTLFKREQKKLVTSDLSDAISQNVDVYYLRPKDAKDDDTEPFLIVFYKNGQPLSDMKAYHFANKYGFEEWTKFQQDKLEEKVKKIEQYGKCISDLFLYRTMAYEILIGKEPEPPDIKEATTPKRPDLETPGPTTQPPNWWLIIGCSVGGFLLLVALVVGYGIYWYNTTIKLLT
ncbi:conserved hypothetical protein [Theileria orientalis strain Shintoku]|uniref:Uncharacterized protein n=1 Tax=Theileria orientalis strain Shintoku TaxID=869250 RepID=J4DNM1_THEOR|nr:conserved hypothetical protein [Theileria orientalis strain Shintoku]BAM39199.1 conserved hypothetical protein [Theileria orientalis strain Shintoku]|eukprot:XP_009689500.1 conserved hypothetical protein [Theileria orientalis strain Shintoku]